ncbi:hypothetical protein Nepgr_016453 [Nepenthes gracilis]|uniref:Uncharacterized protein n=1 Tax=Nepenthes gracilis TaxID=150966 RepID=A0AAD3SQG6_NEPGR|nr:hypothetical protein Nepgr_016453 [Nepenthes gracilis]
MDGSKLVAGAEFVKHAGLIGRGVDPVHSQCYWESFGDVVDLHYYVLLADVVCVVGAPLREENAGAKSWCELTKIPAFGDLLLLIELFWCLGLDVSGPWLSGCGAAYLCLLSVFGVIEPWDKLPSDANGRGVALAKEAVLAMMLCAIVLLAVLLIRGGWCSPSKFIDFATGNLDA